MTGILDGSVNLHVYECLRWEWQLLPVCMQEKTHKHTHKQALALNCRQRVFTRW